jgi:putative SOS response-associated peptidase YedK
MCGRFVIAVSPEAVQAEFELNSTEGFTVSFNVAPTQYAPVITNEHPKKLSFYRWGLVPSWAKDISVGNKMINARADGIAEKPSFRSALKRRRCIVPVSGFYEWQKGEGKAKTPMYIHLKDAEVFGLAGLWEVWNSPDGDELCTFTIITTDANDFMTPIHNRMPVILPKADYAKWLDPNEVEAKVLQPLLKPFDSRKMTAYEVSRAVNTPSINEPDLIRPVA